MLSRLESQRYLISQWHHHQELGRIQLAPTKIHGKSGHIGGDKMSKGR
ncbi:HNH endonuclease [Serratia fonticola]